VGWVAGEGILLPCLLDRVTRHVEGRRLLLNVAVTQSVGEWPCKSHN
jgi:hypothetical protein